MSEWCATDLHFGLSNFARGGVAERHPRHCDISLVFAYYWSHSCPSSVILRTRPTSLKATPRYLFIYRSMARQTAEELDRLSWASVWTQLKRALRERCSSCPTSRSQHSVVYTRAPYFCAVDRIDLMCRLDDGYSRLGNIAIRGMQNQVRILHRTQKGNLDVELEGTS